MKLMLEMSQAMFKIYYLKQSEKNFHWSDKIQNQIYFKSKSVLLSKPQYDKT